MWAESDNFDFLDQTCPKRLFPLQNRKKWYHHWILYIRISLGTKFQLKLTILIFWTKLAQKVYFRFKTEKVNTTFEFWIFELVLVPNFSLNWQIWFFGLNLPKKGVSGLKQKNRTASLNSAYSNSLGPKFQLKLTILIFWTKFEQKGHFQFKTKKWTPLLNSAYWN